MMIKVFQCIFLFILLISLPSCNATALEDDEDEFGIVINISERELYVYRDGIKEETFQIAVGMDSHPTPEGSFKIYQIDWNPDWTPPESEWSEDEDYAPPGDPDNPMGRVRINYDPPYSIHGTQDTESLGEDASHGSVRMGNDDIMALAKILMKAGGVKKSEEWYDDVKSNSGKMVEVELPEVISLINKP